MCGIVGILNFTSTHYVKYENIFKKMLMLDTLRGRDSTGMFVINKKLEVSILKKELPGWDFVESKSFDNMMQGAWYGLVGHNRSATRGTVNAWNAHPFHCGSIVGVHNGTLNIPHPDTDTDSEHLFNMIDDNGWGAIDNLSGALSIVVYDEQNGDVSFARNNERPMWIYHTEEGIVFGSDPNIIEFALKSEDVSWFASYSTTPGVITSIYSDGEVVTKGFKMKEAEKPPVKDYVQTHNQGQHHWPRNSLSHLQDKVISFFPLEYISPPFPEGKFGRIIAEMEDGTNVEIPVIHIDSPWVKALDDYKITSEMWSGKVKYVSTQYKNGLRTEMVAVDKDTLEIKKVDHSDPRLLTSTTECPKCGAFVTEDESYKDEKGETVFCDYCAHIYMGSVEFVSNYNGV